MPGIGEVQACSYYSGILSTLPGEALASDEVMVLIRNPCCIWHRIAASPVKTQDHDS